MSDTPLLKPALFLDRDGTLIQEVDHCHRPEDVTVLPGVAAMLKRAGELGWYRIIITNQSGIGRGYFSEIDFHSVQEELFRQVDGAIDGVYFAPDLPDTPQRSSTRRKPAPGMILEAAADFPIDLKASWMIGDRGSDIGAGIAAGCRTALVLSGYGKEHQECGADKIFELTSEAIAFILQDGSKDEPSENEK